MCVSLTYSYMERYDPEYVPSKTPPKKNTPVPASAPSAQPTVPDPVPPPTVAAPEPANPPPPPKTTAPAKVAKIKSAKDRDFETTKEDLQKIADADGFGQTVIEGPRRHRSGKAMVAVSGSAGSFRGVGRTPESAFRSASNKARGLTSKGQPRK